MFEVKTVVLRNLFRALHKIRLLLKKCCQQLRKSAFSDTTCQALRTLVPESVDKPKPPTPRAKSGSGEARRRFYKSYKCLRPGWGTWITSYFKLTKVPFFLRVASKRMDPQFAHAQNWPSGNEHIWLLDARQVLLTCACYAKIG